MALPDIGLRVDPAKLHPLALRLAELGYQESAIAELLGRWDLSELTGRQYPDYIWRCERSDSDLAKLVAIFLLGRASDRETITGLLGEKLVSNLEKCTLLVEFRGVMVSTAVIFPCLGKFILTDQWVGVGKQEEGKVYEIGPDSYLLARVTPRRETKRALDLCTGSGVHAVFSGAVAEVSKAVDINPRALKYAELNAALNSVSCETLLGDLYGVVEGEEFDLITANPPFVPSPDPNVLIDRSAGESGEEIPERLVAGLPKFLAPGGLFSMVLDHPVYSDETYLDRLERWLGEKNGWGIAVLTFSDLSLGNYISGHLGGVEKYDETFRQYLESYLRLGIQSVRAANVFIIRLDTDEPNWKYNQQAVRPNRSLIPQVENWLDCLTNYSSGSWRADLNWAPSLSSNYKSLWRDWHHQRGVLEMGDDNHFQPEPLNADEAELLFRMQGGEKPLGSLLKTWCDAPGDEASFWLAFRGLGLRRALT